MSLSPAGPEKPETPRFDAGATPRWILILFVVLFVIAAYLLYDGYNSHHTLQAQLAQTTQKQDQLAAELEKTASLVADLKGEMGMTAQKLGLTTAQLQQARNAAQAARKEEQASSKKLQEQLGQMQQQNTAQIGQINTDLGGAKTDIEATKKDLEATKSKLDRSVGDMGVMSGLIAHNKEEVEQLKRLGERNIYEFNLVKSKHPERVGPIEVQLHKIDTKHYRFSLDVIADDRRVEKKDKTAGEPVQFYVRGAHVPYEIVVFDVKKNAVSGYLSTPKDQALSTSAPSNP